jgi:predicted CXXCH cytochrome family protein
VTPTDLVRPTIALAAALLAATPALARDGSPVCQLHGADRALTPSTSCLSCHDGSAAPAVGSGPERTAGTHPAGVPYAGSPLSGANLRPAGQLDPGIVLPAGLVACTSCHDGASREAHHVALSPGRLCVGCHDK